MYKYLKTFKTEISHLFLCEAERLKRVIIWRVGRRWVKQGDIICVVSFVSIIMLEFVIIQFRRVEMGRKWGLVEGIGGVESWRVCEGAFVWKSNWGIYVGQWCEWINKLNLHLQIPKYKRYQVNVSSACKKFPKKSLCLCIVHIISTSCFYLKLIVPGFSPCGAYQLCN